MKRRSIYVLAGLGVVIALVLFWFFALSPLRADIKKTDEELQAERAKLAAAQATLAQVEQTRVEAKKNAVRLIELSKMVPQGDEIPSLLLQIQDVASESGISFMSIKPSDPVGSGNYRSISLDVSFEGHFFDINDFLYRVEQMAAGPGRLLAVTQVNLSTAGTLKKGVSPLLSADMTIEAFERTATAVGTVPATAGSEPSKSASTEQAG